MSDNTSVGAAPPPVTVGLGSLAARGALMTMGGQAGKILLQFGGIIFLARLLAPADYGLFAMVTAVVGIGEVLRDFGLSSAAIQAPHVSQQQRSNLFWINSCIGAALAAVVFLVAPAIAKFYTQPVLEPIAQVLALTFLFNGVATQHRAQLTRDMRFGRLAGIDVSAQAVGLATGLTLAFRGDGYWALVGQQVAQTGGTLLFLVVATGWRPALPRRGAGTGRFLRYGTSLMGTQLITYLSRNVDAVVIGHRFGADLLGLYNRAFQLLMLPLNQLNIPATSIALPVLSRLNGDPERYGRFVLHGQTLLLHVLVGTFAFACAQAEPLIVLVLGPQWAPAVPLFQVLAFAGAFQAASSASYWVYLSKGLTGLHLRVTFVSRVVAIIGIVVGLRWGVPGVAIAVTAGAALTWLWGLLWLRGSGAPVGRMFASALGLMFAYGLCGLASAPASATVPGPLALRLAAGTGGMVAAFLLLLAVWPHFRRSVARVLDSRTLLKSA